jgi:hypothetical protein
VVPVTDDAARLWALWVGDQGGEGLVLKDRRAPYRSGRRTPDWLKVKQRVVLRVRVLDGAPELVQWGDWGWASRVRLTYRHPSTGVLTADSACGKFVELSGAEGTRGTVKAVPESGSHFVRWSVYSSDCPGETVNPCSFAFDRAKHMTAEFGKD